MSQPKRILLFPSTYLPVLGGVQTVAHRLACWLRDQGHEVRVVTHRHPRSLPPEEEIDGIPVHRSLFVSPGWHWLQRKRIPQFVIAPWLQKRAQAELTRFVSDFQPDVLNVHFASIQAPFVERLHEENDFRLVVSLHGDDVEKAHREPGSVSSRNFLSLVRNADSVTACSGVLLHRAAELDPSIKGKGRVAHNGVDMDRFKDSTAYPIDHDAIFAFGRLTEKKGFDLLIEAFLNSARLTGATELVIAGDGKERAQLEAQASAHPAGKRVRFVGRASPEEVVQWLNACRFAVVPSRLEPFGITGVEVLAAGRHLVTTGVEGLAEIIEVAGQTGLGGFVHKSDVSADSLQTGLESALTATEDPGNRSAPFDALSRFRNHFAWDRRMEVYGNALGLNASPSSQPV